MGWLLFKHVNKRRSDEMLRRFFVFSEQDTVDHIAFIVFHGKPAFILVMVHYNFSIIISTVCFQGAPPTC